MDHRACAASDVGSGVGGEEDVAKIPHLCCILHDEFPVRRRSVLDLSLVAFAPDLPENLLGGRRCHLGHRFRCSV